MKHNRDSSAIRYSFPKPPALWAFLYDFNAARHAGVVQASAAEHVFTSYFLQVAKAQQGPNPTTRPSHISR